MPDLSQSVIPNSITRLLKRIDAGEQAAVGELFSQIYDEMRVAAGRLRKSPGDKDLLQTTAIVNEACLRIGQNGFLVSLENRRHLFGAVNRAIQRVLIDYARQRNAKKRSGNDDPILCRLLERYDQACGGQLLDLQEALGQLRNKNPRAADVVELRFWSGLSVHETAELLELSVDTIKRDWRFARAFLHSRLASSK